MTRTQISHFLAVAGEKSFTKAANALYISQPAISKSVASLEAELGFRLLERQESGLCLTSAGQLLRDFFQRVTEEYAALLERIETEVASRSVSIRVGCPDTWNPVFFYDDFRDCLAEVYPGANMTVEGYKLSGLINRVQTGKLDMVVTHDFRLPPLIGFSARRLTSSGCGIVYARERYGEAATLNDFREAEFLLFDSEIEKCFGDVIRRVCSTGGFVPRVRNCGSMSGALFDTACGKSVMLFSDWDSAASNAAYGFLPLDVRLPIKLIYPTEASNGRLAAFAAKLVRRFGG